MNCVHCGTKNPDGQTLCVHCGRDPVLQEEWPADLHEWIPPVLPPEPVTSPLALASLGLGLLAILPLAGIPAIILGHAALIQIAGSNGLRRGRDVARLGLICGYTGLIIFCSLFFGAARYSKLPLRSMFVSSLSAAAPQPSTATPETIHTFLSNANDHEVRALQALVQLRMAENVYNRTNRNVGFTCKFNDLTESGFPDQTLVDLYQNGYSITLQQCRQGKGGLVTGFQSMAISKIGVEARNFCTDETGVIRVPTPEGGLGSCTKTGTPIQ
jgi:Domain of unknown function (DUF4190)